MPTRERVRTFLDVVESGDHVGAIRDFYHADATMQENGVSPRVGRDVLMAHEAGFLVKQSKVHTHPATTVLVDGDNVVIKWMFDVTRSSGETRRLEELSLQTWRGDRITVERFFYDTATAWQVVEG